MPSAVTDRTKYATKPEMSAFGLVVAALSLLALLPVLPFVAALWVYDRVTG